MKFDPIKMQWSGWMLGVHVTVSHDLWEEVQSNAVSRQTFLEMLDDKWAADNTDIRAMWSYE